MIITLGDSDLASLAADIPQVIEGDVAAWDEFVFHAEPQLLLLLRRSRTLGPLRHNIDACRAVMISVLERISNDNFHGLRLWVQWANAHPGKDFGDWIRILTMDVARDHMIQMLDAMLPTDDDDRLSITLRMSRELCEYAALWLESTQLHALHRWIGGASLDQIARELRLATALDADKLVRAALARLRRHFAVRNDP